MVDHDHAHDRSLRLDDFGVKRLMDLDESQYSQRTLPLGTENDFAVEHLGRAAVLDVTMLVADVQLVVIVDCCYLDLFS